MYSLSRSFCSVPRNAPTSTPRLRASAIRNASRIGAVELIVIDTETRSSGMPSNSVSRSRAHAIDTPTLPTSPAACGASGSYPICVGRSNATLNPDCPRSSRKRKRAAVSSALEKPEYWRVVQGRPRYMLGYGPRVKGNSPGWPRRWLRPSGT
jgi:hypothetical protein